MPQSPSDPLLEVVDLRTHFLTPRGAVHAVEGVSLRIKRGETLGIVGESGSGKTIFGRSIMGLLPTESILRSGEVWFEGKDLQRLSRRARARYWGPEIAMVFQNPMTSLNPVVRIGRQIIEALCRHVDLSRREARETAVDLLTSVGIPTPRRMLSRFPHELSGGMRQRVMIAIALSCDPKLLIADEPTTALDVTIQAQILELLTTMQRDRKMAMVLISHDLSLVAGRTDRVAVMYAGRVVEYAPTAQLFADMRMPYTEALMRAIPRMDAPRDAELAGIPGRPPDLIDPPPGCAFAPRCDYAQSRCHEERPPLTESESDHSYACWYPVGTPEGEEALARNRGSETTTMVALERPT